MKTLMMVMLALLLTCGLVYAEGDKNQGTTGTGTTSTGTGSQGTSSETRTGR